MWGENSEAQTQHKHKHTASVTFVFFKPSRAMFVCLARFFYSHTQISSQAAFEGNLMLCANAKPSPEHKHMTHNMKKQKA